MDTRATETDVTLQTWPTHQIQVMGIGQGTSVRRWQLATRRNRGLGLQRLRLRALADPTDRLPLS